MNSHFLVKPDDISQIHPVAVRGGKFGLPLVDVYGKLLRRPSEAAVKAARDALPKDDQVGSEGFHDDFHQKFTMISDGIFRGRCGYTDASM